MIQLAIVAGPGALSLSLSLVAWLLPQEAAWSCAPFLTKELMSTIDQLSPRAQQIVSPCSVLGVQFSVLLPLAILVVVMLRKGPTNRRSRGRVPFLVYLFAVAVVFVVWMDLFVVGAAYAISATGRRGWFIWPAGMVLISSVAVFSALFVIGVAYQKSQALFTGFAKSDH